MLELTQKARKHIHAMVVDQGSPLRLERKSPDDYRLMPSAWRSGDMSYACDGAPILLVDGRLARRMRERALDVEEHGVVVRPANRRL